MFYNGNLRKPSRFETFVKIDRNPSVFALWDVLTLAKICDLHP